MKIVRIGIVGLGRLGFKHAENVVFQIKHSKLEAVCSINTNELEEAKRVLDVTKCFTDFNDMINTVNLDAIIIASPSGLHCKHIILALEKGLHVFCEKPLGISVDECYKVEKAVKMHRDRIFMLGFMRRYDPSYSYAKQKIKEGYIGKPILFRSYSVDSNSTIENILKYIPQSAGQFLDMAVHDIDLARWLLEGNPISIYAIGGCYAYPEFANYGDGDNVSSLMQFDNDCMVFILAGSTAPHGYNVETEIIGTKATLRIGSIPNKNMVEILNKDGVVKECIQDFHERFQKAFVNEIQEFVDCIQQNRKPDIKVEDGTKSTLIAELATQSFKTNTLIKI